MQLSEQEGLFIEEHLPVVPKQMQPEDVSLIQTHVCAFCLHFREGAPVYENHTGEILYHRGNCRASYLETEHFPTISITGSHCSKFTREQK